MKINSKDIRTLLMVVASSLIFSFGFKTFVEAGHLFPGGFSGLATIIIRSLETFAGISIPFGLVYLALNIGPTILVYKHVGKRFAIFSIIQYTLTSFFTTILPSFPITDDLLLIAVFGGIISGFGILLALSVNASSGGTDFIAIFASIKLNKPAWSYVLYFNAIILILAGFLFSWEISLYSIIFQFCSTQIISTMHKRYKLNTLFIITCKSEEVCCEIFKHCRHGITKIDAQGAYSHTDRNLLYMTVNAFQVDEVISSISKIDPKVFISVTKTDRIVGNYYQPPLD